MKTILTGHYYAVIRQQSKPKIKKIEQVDRILQGYYQWLQTGLTFLSFIEIILIFSFPFQLFGSQEEVKDSE